MEVMAVSGRMEGGCSGYFAVVSLCTAVWGPLWNLNWFIDWWEAFVGWDSKVCCVNKLGGEEWRNSSSFIENFIFGKFCIDNWVVLDCVIQL